MRRLIRFFFKVENDSLLIIEKLSYNDIINNEF